MIHTNELMYMSLAILLELIILHLAPRLNARPYICV